MKKSVIALITYAILTCIFFLPVILGEKNFIIHDNFNFFYPLFQERFHLWDFRLQSGFPIGSEPQYQAFYPLQYLFPASSFGFHSYLIFTVISACFFAYLLAFRLTQSFAGALLAGLIFGWSGSITAQVTMAVITVSSSWLPLLVLSHLLVFEAPESRARFLLNACITYLSFTSGSPQTVFFNFLFVYLFIIFKIRYWRIPVLNRNPGGKTDKELTVEKLELKSVYTVFFSTAAGILLSSVSLFPLVELMKYSDRSASVDKAAFNSYHFSFSDLIKIPFPYSFGGLTENSLFSFSYIYQSTAVDNFHEHQRYMGIISFILAFIGWKCTDDRRLKIFLGFGFIFYLLYSLGMETPFGRLIYGIPVLNKFRGPNRHILELTLIISILSAFGIKKISEREKETEKKERFYFISFTVLFITALFAVIMSVPDLKSRYSAVSFFSFYGNNLITFQIFILLISSIIYYFLYNKLNKKTVFIFHFILAADLLVTARYQDWYSLSEKSRDYTELEKKVQQLTADSGTFTKFIIPGHEVRDYYAVPNTMHENLNDNRKVNMNIRGSSIYSPLAMKDSVRMIQLTEGDPLLGGLFNYKYTGLVYSSPVSSVAKPWKAGTCPNNIAYMYSEKESDVLFAENIVPSRGKLALITSADCLEENLPPEEILGTARFYSTENRVIEKTIRKKDTVPSFAPCSHMQKNLYRKFRYDRTKCGFTAETEIDLPENFEIRKISFLSEKGILIVYSVSAGEGADRRFHYPVNSEIIKAGSRAVIAESGLAVYENISARPEFYFADSVSVRTHEEIYNDFITKKYVSLGTSGVYTENGTSGQKLADSVFSPLQGKIISFQRNHHSVSLLTESQNPQFLVLNHSFYPGWKAYIDGQETEIYRTNYIMRGVSIPAGNHRIEFKYRPSAFYTGLAVSISVFICMIFYFLLGKFKKNGSVSGS